MTGEKNKLKQNTWCKEDQASLHGGYQFTEVGKAVFSRRYEKRFEREPLGVVRVGFLIHLLNNPLHLLFLVLYLPSCACLVAFLSCNSHIIQSTHLNYMISLVYSQEHYDHSHNGGQPMDILIFEYSPLSTHWQLLFYFFVF